MDDLVTSFGNFDGPVRCLFQPEQTSNTFYPFLVDVQSALLADLATRIVIPLGNRSAFGGQAMQGLTHEISFDGQELLLLTPQISSVPEK
nr:CcdB family protein [uncultured Halomonas sp.]